MSIITISGTPGSGKSTVAEILTERLDIPYIYSGQIFRQLAKEYQMSLEEFGKFCEENEKVDKELDKRQLEILKRGNVILEGRLAGWLAYKNDINALKVMIDADISIRAQRVVKRESGSAEVRKKEIIKREKSEAKRYKKYYGIDLFDKSIYDLVIDSAKKTPEEVAQIIINKLQ